MDVNFSDFFTSITDTASIFFLLFMIVGFLLGMVTGAILRSGRIKRLKKEVKEKENLVVAAETRQKELNDQLGLREADLRKIRLNEGELQTKINSLEADKREIQKSLNKASDRSLQLENSSMAYQDTIRDLETQLVERDKVISVLKASTSAAVNATTDSYTPTKQKGAPAPEETDDLSLINGVGPFIEKKLNEVGVYQYAQIASWTKEDIEQITTKIQFFPGRIEQDNWVEQAQQLLKEKARQSIRQQQLATVPSDPTDLKVIDGIGPRTEDLLKDNGIKSWHDLANLSVEQLKNLLLKTGAPFDILDPNTWAQQARLAANGEWERLKEYQDYLNK